MSTRSLEAPVRRRFAGVWIVAALLLYMGGILAVLLSPVSPEALVTAVTGWLRTDAGFGFVRQGWVEFGANVALFVPLGLLLTLAFRRAWPGVFCALALSCAAEIAQMLLPGRMASLRDVLANLLGATIGVVVALVIRAARAKARSTGR